MRARAGTLLLLASAVALAQPLGSRILQFGDSGDDVAQLQTDLRLAGCNPDEADGRFSPKTEREVRAFQELKGLPVTGLVDAATAGALTALERAAPAQNPVPEGLPLPPPGWLRGIDVSEFDVNVDWAAVASSGITFAIARAADGLAIDPFFANNWAGMQQSGLMRGVSQYFRASQDPGQQADLLAAEIGTVGAGDFPPFLEVSTQDGASPAVVAAGVAAWVKEIQAKVGATPIIATSRCFWQSIGSPSPAGCALWVKDLGASAPDLPRGWRDWKFWQYSSAGSLDGINGAVDLDYFHGSRSDLNALAGNSWANTMAATPSPPATPPQTPSTPATPLTPPTPAQDPLAAFVAPMNQGQPPAAPLPTTQQPANASSPFGGAGSPAPVASSPQQQSSPGASPSPGGTSTSPSNTIGVAPALDGLGMSGQNNGPIKSYNGQMPPAVHDALVKALAADGLPASWINSNALKQILAHESSFNPTAQNPSSTAYGLFQFLNSTWKGVGATKTSDPYLQSVAGLKYIQQRYGNPDNAWAFWQAHHWY